MGFLTKGIVVRRTDILSATAFSAFIISYAWTWRGVVMFLYFESFGPPLHFDLLYTLSFVLAALVGGFLLDKVKRRVPFFLLFLGLGLVSFIPILFKTTDILQVYLAAVGIFQGLILPSALSFLADATEIQERGRVAGIAWITFGLLGIISVFTALWSLDLYFLLMAAGAVVMGLGALLFAEERISSEEEWRRVPMISIFGDRNFLHYMGVAAGIGFLWGINRWIVGHYVGGIFLNPHATFWVAVFSVHVISGFFVGVLMDRVGRRPVIAIGALSFAPGFMSFVAYGEIWTFLVSTIFFGLGYACTYIPMILVVWGDLARKEARGRTYGTGLVGLIVGSTFGFTVGQLIFMRMFAQGNSFVSMAVISVTAFLLISITARAKETLPPKERIEEIRDYIKQIKEESDKRR